MTDPYWRERRLVEANWMDRDVLRQLYILRYGVPPPMLITDLNLGELTMCHIVVLLWRFSGMDAIVTGTHGGQNLDGCFVRRKHRCAFCINNLALTCRTTHRWFYYHIKEEVLVRTSPPWLAGMSEYQIRTWCRLQPRMARQPGKCLYGSNILRYVGRARRHRLQLAQQCRDPSQITDPSEWPLGGEFYHTTAPYFGELRIGFQGGPCAYPTPHTLYQ